MSVKVINCSVLLSLCSLSFFTLSAENLSLSEAIVQAKMNDPWLSGNRLKQKALIAKSVASSQFDDPKVSLSLMNLPVDSWQFNQEAMTQFKVGISQTLPRGDSLAIKKAQLEIQASKHPLLHAQRSAKVTAVVSQLWLDAYLAQQTINLINADKNLFEQMVDIAQANYASTAANTRQQDVIRAQLELLQLDDRLSVYHQKLELSVAKLNQWLYAYDASDKHYLADFSQHFNQQQNTVISDELPKLSFLGSRVLTSRQVTQNHIAQAISEHPALRAIDVNYKAANKSVELAHQQYKPQWGVNASYAYRDEAENNSSRADFFSMGVTFDLPLFTENKQDKTLVATVAESEAIKTEKLLLLRTMVSDVEQELANLKRLSQRQSLYSNQLLQQTNLQTQAALTAYTHDDGSFPEVVRASIAQLNARITALSIEVDALKTIARLNYYFSSPSSHALVADSSFSEEK